MPEDVIVIRGELGKIDYSSYQFFFDNFENSNYREISADELLNSKSNEAFWRVKISHRIFDIVKWTTPKRTRSYPLARCYSLLSSPNQKVSAIPIVKDEGFDQLLESSREDVEKGGIQEADIDHIIAEVRSEKADYSR